VDKLAEICAMKREEVAARKGLATLDDLDRAAASAGAPRGFRLSLEAAPRAVVAG
jgi:indole-3-glycerol phosphate synthase